jgi:ribosomal protein S27E
MGYCATCGQSRRKAKGFGAQGDRALNSGNFFQLHLWDNRSQRTHASEFKELQNTVTPSSSSITKVHRYPCPGCSADLVFEPRDGHLACPYCGRTEQIPASADQIQERSYEAYLELKPEQLNPIASDALEVQCTGCGATVSFSPPEVAGECAFCAAKIVTQPQATHPMLAPESVLPFRVTHHQAADAIKGWLASRWFAPSALLRLARQESAKGVYLPFWTYDAYTVSHYTGERGEYYWETESYVDRDSSGNLTTRTRQVRKTRWRSVSGKVTRWFDDVLVPATRCVSAERLDALNPWDLPDLKPYQPAYLAGYKAQRYQVELREGFEKAKALMEHLIEDDVRGNIGGDEQRVHQIRTAYSAITFKHLLAPVWIGAYRFRDRVYQVLVNARTGEAQGERPYSGWKITGFVIVLLLVLLLLLYLSNQ